MINYLFIFPEIILTSSLSIIIIIDLFLSSKNKHLSYYLIQILLFSLIYLIYSNIQFLSSNVSTIYDTNIFSTYTYRISSYLWTTSYIFVGAYLLNNQDLLRKYKSAILPLFLFVPIGHYFLSTGYYPNSLIDVFIKYSDKFEFTKASDIMLSVLIANILNYKLTVSKYFKFSYMLFSICLLSPLLLLMSRGSFVSIIIFAKQMADPLLV